MIRRTLSLAAVLAAIVTLSGCATSRSVVEAKVATTPNPAQGVAVRIDKVVDERVFQIAPSSPNIPSLSDNDIQNKATTSRAIARKRNGFGQALGDVLLPEGQTVADLTGSALAQAFRESGYRVLSPGQPGYDEAAPVSARIQEFWAWGTPGFFYTVEQRTTVAVSSPLNPLASGQTVSGYSKDALMAATDESWKDAITKGLADMMGKLKAVLAAK